MGQKKRNPVKYIILGLTVAIIATVIIVLVVKRKEIFGKKAHVTSENAVRLAFDFIQSCLLTFLVSLQALKSFMSAISQVGRTVPSVTELKQIWPKLLLTLMS